MRALVVEDLDNDYLLLQHALQDLAGGIEWTRVQTPDGLRAALEDGGHDFVLCDFHLPGFDALDALEIARESGFSRPFVVVSGIESEERCVEVLRAGAWNFVPKSNLERLPGVIERELSRHLEREAAEAALRESEDRLHALLQGAPGGLVLIDDSDRIRLANRTVGEMFGRDADELVGIRLGALVPQADLPAARERSSGGSSPEAVLLDLTGDQNSGYLEGVRKDGTRFPVVVQLREETTQGLCLRVACILDCSQRQLQETRIRTAHRFETLGRLTAGIAHDFRNLLSVITSAIEVAMVDPADRSGCEAELRVARHAAQRGAGLVRQLLAFGRQQELDPIDLDVHALIRQTAEMIRRVAGREVEVRIDLSEGHGPVHVDPRHLERALMNLALNAVDAMPDGGTLTLGTSSEELHGESLGVDGDARAGRFVVLWVQDSGHGIPPDLLHKVFEPFFSTKPEGQGSGLGLASVYGIVKQSGGEIGVESSAGEGACFRIYLPEASEEAQSPVEERPATPPPGPEPAPSLTILLVEDEPDLRAVAVRLLASLGHDVLDAGDAPQALELAAGRESPIDVLLTDIQLGDDCGIAVATEIRACHPETRIVFMSGLDREEIRGRSPLPEAAGFLEKPFSRDALAAILMGT